MLFQRDFILFFYFLRTFGTFVIRDVSERVYKICSHGKLEQVL